ncbi:hypothetical protein FDZ71_08115, partial [bacterium]
MDLSEGFLATPPNFAPLALKELSGLGIAEASPTAGGITFRASKETVYRVNLNSRVGTRVLLRVARFPARSFKELEKNLKALPWRELVDFRAGAAFSVSCSKTKLCRAGKIEEITRLAAGRHEEGDGATLFLRIAGDEATLSRDTSGELLHRRGYRTLTVAAPIRENLAAGLLLFAGYDGSEPLLDPCCGSGTFAVEGALIALKRAPGLFRSFALETLPDFDGELWEKERQRAMSLERKSPQAPIFASDIDPEAVGLAVSSARGAKVADFVAVAACDMDELEPPTPTGLLVANPPYGIRLGKSGEVYGKLLKILREPFGGWRSGIIAPRGKAGAFR